ncbi:MAG: flagellar hook-associated protein 3 [Pseudomonadota bacterium]|jgi:flagellar hook-associated protein 3 FlgL
MRITDNMRLFNVGRNLSQLSTRQAAASDQASSGLKVRKPSDDPVAAAKLARISAALEQASAFRETIHSTQSDAASAEGALSESIDLFARARELAIQGANGSLNAENRAVLARETASLRAQLLSLANSKGASGYLFSGNKTQTAAFDGTGTYQGDSGTRDIEVAPGVVVSVAIAGEEAFAGIPGGVNVFDELANLESALLTNNGTLISASLGGLDAARAQLTESRSRAGIVQNRLDMADNSLAQGELGLTKQQSSLADVDAFEAVSELSQVGTTLEQAISVARNILNTSLLRF